MYRDVAVKTLIGKGKYDDEQTLVLEVDKTISKTLGCWIINHKCNAKSTGRNITIEASYDIELWYAVDGDQKSQVKSKNISFVVPLNMAFLDLQTLNDKLYLKTFVKKYPTCAGMDLKENGLVTIKVIAQYIVDAFAEAILAVQVSDNNKSDLTLEEEIVMNVNPNYLTTADQNQQS